jgi:hypothetical protein
MTLSRPTGTVRTGVGGGLDAGVLATGPLDLPQAGVSWLRVDLSVDAAHDRIELGLHPASRLAGTPAGETITVALGDSGEDTDVLTGQVAGLFADAAEPVLVAYAPSLVLATHRVGRAYLRMTVAEVVRDLLDDAGVDAGDLDAPQLLAAHHIDPRRPVWGHLHALARLVGAQVTSNADGAVAFGPAPGASPSGGLGGLAGAAGAVAGALGVGGRGGLRSGATVLALRGGPTRAEAAAVVPVARLGAASGLGPNRWYHLVAAPDSGTDLADVAPAVRDADLADAATAARADAARREQRSARLVVRGDTSLRAGAELDVDDTPWRVLRVRHLLSRSAGYRCELALEGT